MLSYVLGNSIKKRARFVRIKSDEELYIDDMSIACDVIKNGVYYYATESRPFKNIRVGDFISYSRSLFDKDAINKKHVRSLLKSVGYKGSLRQKISKVSAIDYLKILVCSKVKDTTRVLYLNLDVFSYSIKNLKRLKKLAYDLSNFTLYFLVSDLRFCENGDEILYLNSSSELVELSGEYKRKKTSKRKIYSILNLKDAIS